MNPIEFRQQNKRFSTLESNQVLLIKYWKSKKLLLNETRNDI